MTQAITIVSGLPRSGTSLMMQMLVAGGMVPLTDAVREADVDNPRGYYEYEPVKRTAADPSWLATAGGRVVKMVYRLLYDLPPEHTYAVVLMRRDLREVVASQAAMLDRLGRSGAALSEDQLIGVYTKELAAVETWLAERPHFSVLTVNYNQLVSDPVPTARGLAVFAPSTLDLDAMVAAVDPSLYRQRTS